MKRLTGSWLNPEKHRKTSGYQLYHSHLALGSGGLDGVGFNRSRMKQAYLPEAHTDFIMSIVGEELGFLGLLAVMLIYLLLMGAADRQGMLLGFGIGVSVGIHAFINLSVVSGLLPTTGVTAPLVSYGGSSMLITWVGIGILGNVARIGQNEDLSAEIIAAKLSENDAFTGKARA